MTNKDFPIDLFKANIRDSYIGRINNINVFRDFNRKAIGFPIDKNEKSQSANRRLVIGIDIIYREVRGYRNGFRRRRMYKNVSKYLLRTPLTYYQLYSDLFSIDYHKVVLQKSSLFRKLKNKKESYIFNIVKNYKNSLYVGINASDERDYLAEKLDDGYKSQLSKLESMKNTLDNDISTLSRQGRINRDQLLRQEYKKTILRFTLVCICLLIFVSYMTDLGVNDTVRIFLYSLILLIYFVKILMYYLDYIKRHNSDFNYKGYTTYPGTQYSTIKNDSCSSNDKTDNDSNDNKWFEFNFLNNKNKKCSQ
jgi:hypothetical protein